MFAALLALLGWMAWIRRQYAFGKGGMMERVRQTILSSLDFDGRGSLLEVGCGSGALAVRAALTWPEARITGLDYWGALYNYSQALCERNAASEGVGKQRVFVLRDSMKPQMYGDMNAFAQELRDMGFTEVRYAETSEAIFGSKRRAAMMMLGSSGMLVGRK